MNDEAKTLEWAIIELMGHVTTAGQISEETKFGKAFLRFDHPGGDGVAGFTQWINPDSLYRVTPTTEQVARVIAAKSFTKPAVLFNLERNLQQQLESGAQDEEVYEEDY